MREKDLDRAVERVKNLKEGEKRRLIIKAVVNYINSMIGDVDGSE